MANRGHHAVAQSLVELAVIRWKLFFIEPDRRSKDDRYWTQFQTARAWQRFERSKDSCGDNRSASFRNHHADTSASGLKIPVRGPGTLWEDNQPVARLEDAQNGFECRDIAAFTVDWNGVQLA